MASWAGALIETDDREALVAAMERRGVTLEVEGERRWYYVESNVSFASLRPPSYCRELSAELGGRVIGFFVQTTSGVEQIDVFDNAKHVRTLRYSLDEGGWLEDEGEPQEWEALYFFPPDTGIADDEEWPGNLLDEISDEDLARYGEARAQADARPVMKLLMGGSVWPLFRVMQELGVDPKKPDGQHEPPANRALRWKVYGGFTLFVLLMIGMYLLGRY